MRRRIWAGIVVLLSTVLINGCSKCSHDETIPAPPPGAPPVQDANPNPPPGDESEELPPGDQPTAPATPATPNGAPAPGAGESAD